MVAVNITHIFIRDSNTFLEQVENNNCLTSFPLDKAMHDVFMAFSSCIKFQPLRRIISGDNYALISKIQNERQNRVKTIKMNNLVANSAECSPQPPHTHLPPGFIYRPSRREGKLL